jgi:hypothetical protein
MLTSAFVLAYLDANSGSMIAAALAGGGAGVIVLFRMYGYRILGVFSKRYRTKADEQQAELVGDETEREPAKSVAEDR